MFGFKKLKRYLRDPKFALGCDLIQKHPNWMSDKFFTETEWRIIMGYKLDLRHPETFNEKLQYLKLHDRNSLYTTLVDKVLVKDWVEKKIGTQYVIPTLAVWDSAEKIDITDLPDQFVLKCNHDSGSVIICKDKANFDIVTVKEKLGKSLKFNWYYKHREWAYKNVKPCILAEPYLLDSNSNEKSMTDYKFYCFNGIPKFLYVSSGLDRNHETANISFANLDWTLSPFYRTDFSELRMLPSKPKCFDEMIELSKRLSSKIPFVRVDWYEKCGRPYLSEMTFYPGGSPTKYVPEGYDSIIGDMLDISELTKKTNQ